MAVLRGLGRDTAITRGRQAVVVQGQVQVLSAQGIGVRQTQVRAWGRALREETREKFREMIPVQWRVIWCCHRRCLNHNRQACLP